MNRRAQFNVNAQDILPEQPTFEYFTHSVTTVSFHPIGNLMAVGTEKGPIGLWELEVMNIRQMISHIGKITGLEWINGFLWSSCSDGCIIEWDIGLSLPSRIFRFDAPIFSFLKNPMDHELLLVKFSMVDYVICKIESDLEIFEIPILNDRLQIISNTKKSSMDASLVATWSYDGTSLLIGDSVGDLTEFHLSNSESIVHNITRTTYTISDIECSKVFIMLNATDRILRLLNHEFEELYTFQDIVNRYPWNSCTFSNDCEYIIASGDRFNASQISIFESSSFRLIKTLNPYNDRIQSLIYHPCYHTLAAITEDGKLCLHALLPTFSWGAFEPRFKEIETNEEYLEDINDMSKAIHECKTSECDCLEEMYMNHNIPSALLFNPIFPGRQFHLDGQLAQKSKEISDEFIEIVEDDNMRTPPLQQSKINFNLPRSAEIRGVSEKCLNLVSLKPVSKKYPILPTLPKCMRVRMEEISNELFEQ